LEANKKTVEKNNKKKKKKSIKFEGSNNKKTQKMKMKNPLCCG
jgi:hypothetical protein